MIEHDDAPAEIGWLRALFSAAIIAIVGIVALVYGPNWVLTKVSGKTRSSLVAAATTLFFVILFVLAWALRRLQSKKII
jgi:hypothetical protein